MRCLAGDDGATFVKRHAGAPEGFFAAEAAGLAWLAAAQVSGGATVVRSFGVGAGHIVLERLHPTTAGTTAAERLGRGLAATHRSGAPWFGSPPEGWATDGFVGPLPMTHVHAATDGDALRWGAFYAHHRLVPFARRARDRGWLRSADAAAVDAVCARLADDDPDLIGPVERPARIHGDLWGGNIVWTARGGVLIDPAAHGGHRETDLAMLALFGLPHLERVLAAYRETFPLAQGWRDRVALHQLHPLLVHAALFGGGYGAQAGAAARHCG